MHAKLPEFKFPTFSEEIPEWPVVWSLFDALFHSRDKLDDTVKFTHLLNCLAYKIKELYKGFAVTHANYALASKQLQLRYDDHLKLLQMLLHKLHVLPAPKHNYVELKMLKAQYVQLRSQF